MWSRGRKKMPTNELVLFESQDKSISLNVPLKNDSVWLNRNQMAELFDRDVKTIGKHVNNAIREELAGLPVVAKFATTAADGKTYMVDYYDLDVIISVGYRVKSQRGVEFRKWANSVLRQYIMEGYADALKALKGDAKELAHETVAHKALVQIAAIYKAEEALKELTAEERYGRRQREVKPLVEAYFAWVHEQDPACILSEKTREGLKYSLNQEKYLRQHPTIASADISESFVPILQFEKLER